MSNNVVNESFSQKFAAVHRARLYPEERKFVENSLGNGAIKFKLGKQGFRTLMVALNAEDKKLQPQLSRLKD